MDAELYLLKNRANLNIVYLRIKNSLEDIEKNNAHRTDLIKSMTDSQISVGDALDCLIWIEKEWRCNNKRNFNLELINLQLLSEIKELKKINKDLLNQINL